MDAKTGRPGAARTLATPLLVMLSLLIFVALLVSLHGYTLRWPFISDDYIFLTKTRRGTLGDLFLGFNVVQNYFRPIGRELYFYGVSRFAGNSPLVFRLVNLCVLTSIIGMVMALARRFSSARAAIFAGAAFTLLYTNSLLMGWVSGSQDLLATALGLLATLLYLQGRVVWAAAAYFLALFSKESVAPLPLILATWEVWRQSPKWREGLRQTRPLWLAAVLWAAIVISARVWKQAWVPGESVPVADVTLEPGSILEGLRSALLTFFYVDQPFHDLGESISRLRVPWLAMLLAACVGVLASFAPASDEKQASAQGWRLGLVWTILAALPPALAGHHFSAYYVTFAGVGFALIAGPALARCPRAIAIAVLVIAVIMNMVANGVDNFRVTRAQQMPPGVSCVTIARLKAEVHFLRTLRKALLENPPPRGASIYLSYAPRGVSFATAGSYAPQVWFNDPDLDLTYIRRYQPHADARPAIFLRFNWNPWNFTAVPESLVDAIVDAEDLMEKRDWPAARAALERVLGTAGTEIQDEERASLLNSYGLAAKQTGDTTAARRAWLDALRIEPSQRGALLNLAGIEASRGRYAEARERVLAALQAQPNDPLALYYLARLERALGNTDAAVRAWQRLVSADPQFADSLTRAGAPM